MLFQNISIKFLKRLALFILIVAIAIPLRHGTTNRQHLVIRVVHALLTLKHSLLSDVTRPTLSAEFRAFENLLRLRPIPERDPLSDPSIIIKDLRSTSNIANLIPKPFRCKINKQEFEHNGHTVDAYWIDYPAKMFQKDSDKVLLFLHGGGYICGGIEGYSGLECRLSEIFNVTILHVEYRLSPEHPSPAAVDDTVALYHALLRHGISPSQIMFMGDSAGGGLALLTIQGIIFRQLPIPRGVIALSPWADLSNSGESFTRNNGIDLIFTPHDVNWVSSQVLGSNYAQLSLNHALYSPLFGSFEGFPPTFINVGTAEILEDDAKRVLKKAQEAGVDVTFEEGFHMLHVYPVLFSYFPEAWNTLDNINKWIQRHFEEKDSE